MSFELYIKWRLRWREQHAGEVKEVFLLQKTFDPDSIMSRALRKAAPELESKKLMEFHLSYAGMEEIEIE